MSCFESAFVRRLCLVAAATLVSTASFAQPATGDPEKGKILWQKTEHVECFECHGVNGQGALGPDLAGRNLTRAQFLHAVRKPWGVMPAYPESQISDRDLDDIRAFFSSLPSLAEPGPVKRPVPAGASPGLAIAHTAGCAQCHAPAFNTGRAVIGALGTDFEWFKSIVYEHPTAYPPTRARLGEEPQERLAMGSFSRSRVPESMLREVWSYISDLGFRARMQGKLTAGVPSATGVTYTLDVKNTGEVGKGLAAEDMTVMLAVPAGATVVTATGAGYQGVRHDDQLKADVAVWTIPRMGPQDRQSYTLTLSQAGAVRGTMRWMKPAVKTAPFDAEPIAPAPGTGRPQ